MHISRLIIKNFKSYENVEINLADKVNLIIGENNIGKTTIFEAILLWGKCYEHNIQKNCKEFYRNNPNIYINFSELHFLRVVRDDELFFDKRHDINLKAVFTHEQETFSLSFIIEKPKSINNAYFRCKMEDYDEFSRFANGISNLNMKLNEAINFYQTAPVSHILVKEPYMNIGQVKKKIGIGKSNEVLRNKIISIHQKSTQKSEQLRGEIQRVIGSEFTFKFPPRTKMISDEYIDLRIDTDTTSNDICMQGSGFLQICEIFSTIDFFDNAINILLVDEPDSHIHAKLQQRLLEELRSIDNTQILIISHNDRFLENVEDDHLLFINKESKGTGTLDKIDISQINRLKIDLGGITLSLCMLNNATNVVFCEGKDDIDYIKSLYNKCRNFMPLKQIHYATFFHIRGRDYIVKKIENVNRVLNSLFANKKYFVVFDKDFCVKDSANALKSSLEQLNRNNLKGYYHNGYCIESVLFSDNDKLSNFLLNISGENVEDIGHFLDEWFLNIKNDIHNLNSELYINFSSKFKSQKTEARPELNAVEFEAFCREIDDESIHYLMNKSNIKKFIKDFECRFNCILIAVEEDESEEFYSSQLLSKYISYLNNEDELFSSYKELMIKLFI